MTTILDRLNKVFPNLPDSQIDIKLTMSNGENGVEFDFVLEGVNEWGDSFHIASGIDVDLLRAMDTIATALEDRVI